MKGEYLDSQSQQHHHHHHEKLNMFSPHHHHRQQLPLSHICEDDSKHNNSSDGATIEVIRRPRGRPPGSKNKPKAPPPPPHLLQLSRDPPMTPYILELPSGADLLHSISRFSRRKNIGICVLTGSGTVSNVTLRQPSTTPPATITFHGRFDILSISATFFPQTLSYSVPNAFTISLAGPQGQIVGGIVAGTLVAATTVYVIAATFSNPTFYRLPVEEEDIEGSSNSGQSPSVSGAGGGGDSSCGMVMYSAHLPSDLLWARPPPPPSY